MTVNVLLVTHTDVGKALMQVVHTTFGQIPEHWHQLAVSYQEDPDALLARLHQTLSALQDQDGTLILSDVFGATPCNMALSLKQYGQIRLISGVNLPMLFKLVNYKDLPLDELADKALLGGREGIRLC